MSLNPIRIDDEIIFDKLLKDTLPSGVYTVLSELDVDTIDNLPAVIYSTTSPGQSQNGPGLWPVTLTLVVIGKDVAEAAQAATDCYATVHGWSPPGVARVAGHGQVEDVEDDDLFSRSPTPSLIGKTNIQYVGSFDVLLRSI